MEAVADDPRFRTPAPDAAVMWLATHGPLEIRSCHPYAFRSGKWARILSASERDGHWCWVVRFPDGQSDWLVVDDSAAAWEYRSA